MKINFTEQESKEIKDIVEKYRNVSEELYLFQKKAEEIQDKVIELKNTLNSIKEKEDSMMTELHSKYGQFGLQDIYESIYYDR